MQAKQKAVVNVSITVLRTLSALELDTLAIEASKTVKEGKDLVDFSRRSNPVTGKVICALEERMEKAKAENFLAKNMSLARYWEGITKTKMPGHAMSCGVAFGTLVRTEQIDEKTYDLCSANMLELAGAISNAVDCNVTHEAIAKTVEQLKERGKDAMKNLRAILLSVKPRKPMDAEDAAERLKQIFADGHLNLTFAVAAAEMCYLEPQSDEAKDSYFALSAAGITVDKHFGDEQIDKWINLFQKPNAPANTPAPNPNAIQLPAPAPQAPVETAPTESSADAPSAPPESSEQSQTETEQAGQLEEAAA